jgi:hypothetical protein
VLLAAALGAAPAGPIARARAQDLIGVTPGESSPALTAPPGPPPPAAPGSPPFLPPAPGIKGGPQGTSTGPVGFGIVQVRTVLNVRAGPWGPILGTLGPNSLVRIVGRQGPWYVIEWNGRRAFVHSEYIMTPENNPFGGQGRTHGTISSPGGTLVRGTPWGTVVGALPPGAPVQVLGRTLSWYQVQAGNVVGYVPAPSIDPGARMPAGPPTPPRAGPPGGTTGYPGQPPPRQWPAPWPGQWPAPVPPGQFPPIVAPPPTGIYRSYPGRGARAARGPNRHPGYPTVNLPVFPVPGATRYSDDFHVGTHSPGRGSIFNEGIDIFAPAGSPILAPIGARVLNVGANPLGGLTVMMLGPDGTVYYFAHLSRHQPGIRPGMVVPAGTVIGYVGNSGNAAGGPPHLHFAAVRGGRALAPYVGLAQCP